MYSLSPSTTADKIIAVMLYHMPVVSQSDIILHPEALCAIIYCYMLLSLCISSDHTKLLCVCTYYVIFIIYCVCW